jgi:hypothetical protein
VDDDGLDLIETQDTMAIEIEQGELRVFVVILIYRNFMILRINFRKIRNMKGLV